MGIRFKTLCLCVVAMGALFTFLGWQAKLKKQELEAQGVSTPGTITSAEVQRGSKGKKRYLIKVTWGEGADRRENEFFTVKKDFFASKVQDTSTIVSPEVTVRHLPGKPDTAIIVGGSSDNSGMEWLGYILGGLGLLGCARAFLFRR